MKKILGLLFVIKCLSLINTVKGGMDYLYKENWEAFKKQYGRNFTSLTEEKIRMKIFIENLQKIHNNNNIYEKGGTQYQMGLNQFADMPYSEFLDKVGKFNQSVQYDRFKDTWNSYKTRFQKNYTTDVEDRLRMMIFADNLRLLLEHNERYKKGEETYPITMDYFTDMLYSEMVEWKRYNPSQMNNDYEVIEESPTRNEVTTQVHRKETTLNDDEGMMVNI